MNARMLVTVVLLLLFAAFVAVNWNAIVEGGSTRTNYQVLPGDRIFVKADSLITFDNRLAKLLSPVERILGVTLLGATTVNAIRINPNNNNNFGGGGAVVAP